MINSLTLLLSNHWFLILCLTPAFSQTFNVKPYLQNATPTSIHIMWESTSGEETIVQWGENSDFGFTTTGDAVNSIDSFQIHDVHLTNLNPDTRIFYKVITESLESDIFDFVTPTSSGFESSLRLVAMSDMQKDWSCSFLMYWIWYSYLVI